MGSGGKNSGHPDPQALIMGYTLSFMKEGLMKVQRDRCGTLALSGMFLVRTGSFLFFQGIIAFILFTSGHGRPWFSSAGWWPVTASLGSLLSILLLVRFHRREGRRYGELFRFPRGQKKKDWAALAGIILLLGPVAFLPNTLLARGLFGDPEAALDLLFQPLPFWAVAVSLSLFPLTVALSELPLYFAYVAPRLEQRTGKPWLSWGSASFWLAAQHMALPFLPDFRFLLWRLGMFLPFAVMLALVLRRRPGLLPALVIIHFLMDLSTGLLVFFISQ